MGELLPPIQMHDLYQEFSLGRIYCNEIFRSETFSR